MVKRDNVDSKSDLGQRGGIDNIKKPWAFHFDGVSKREASVGPVGSQNFNV